MLRKLDNLERIRSERSLTVKELSRASGVPSATITGLEEGTRRARQTTADKLAGALGVEPGELANEEGVTVLEEKVGDRVRVVKCYDDYTLDISFDAGPPRTLRRDASTGISGRRNSAGRWSPLRGGPERQAARPDCSRYCRSSSEAKPAGALNDLASIHKLRHRYSAVDETSDSSPAATFRYSRTSTKS